MNIKEYLGLNSVFEDKNGNRMSHEEMYSAIVDAIGLDNLVPLLPADKETLLASYKEDEHLNNIPLQKWDLVAMHVKKRLNGIGITVSSVSQTVSIMKRAARMHMVE